MYKADWLTFGGFDTEKYTFSWGGEDWDILDKLVQTTTIKILANQS